MDTTQKNAKANLQGYNNSWYNPGGGVLKRLLWYFVNAIIFQTTLLPINKLKVVLLRAFGAKVGNGVVIKPSVNIKYPWQLTIGNYCWLGEEVWIDNLTQVTLEDNVCISQGAMLLCGSHNYTDATFGLITKPIYLKEGCWVGAKALVCPGITIGSHAVLAAASVATCNLDAYCIYQGNPATFKRKRTIVQSVNDA